ncbi:hypothetical protein [Burkholderia pyrrocinia]|uniref:hypothetical protein n=1 Tax=Burkholderia pyrrocinia TaxID=60550 RepID=UPI0010451EAC|nr:hypothetical protein [Burkholderia pyrrocinia]TDA46055.1 hypothetical protein EVG18_18280 [Burkholderia pyrrocinia]UOB60726.1 hypothetical protein MRS60_32530 [Burkholderia pyrrocinia]
MISPCLRGAVNADGKITTPGKLAGTVLRWNNGAAVRLGDAAAVAWASAPAVGAASIMGRPGVMLPEGAAARVSCRAARVLEVHGAVTTYGWADGFEVERLNQSA